LEVLPKYEPGDYFRPMLTIGKQLQFYNESKKEWEDVPTTSVEAEATPSDVYIAISR